MVGGRERLGWTDFYQPILARFGGRIQDQQADDLLQVK